MPASGEFRACYFEDGGRVPKPCFVEEERVYREGERVLSRGYVHVWTSSNGLRAEHRVVMEAMLGRPMVKGESVHHKNGIPADNRPENLELWVGPIRSGVRAVDLTCPHCGKAWKQE